MENEKNQKSFANTIASKERRKLRSLKGQKRSALYGFGLFGMVGWAIIVPLLVFTALGKWLDIKYPQTFSWTLSLLFVGLIIGCWIAWEGVFKEHKKMNSEE